MGLSHSAESCYNPNFFLNCSIRANLILERRLPGIFPTFRGLPGSRVPRGLPSSAAFIWHGSSIRCTWSLQNRLHCLLHLAISSTLHCSLTSEFLTRSLRVFPMILRRFPISATRSLRFVIIEKLLGQNTWRQIREMNEVAP